MRPVCDTHGSTHFTLVPGRGQRLGMLTLKAETKSSLTEVSLDLTIVLRPSNIDSGHLLRVYHVFRVNKALSKVERRLGSHVRLGHVAGCKMGGEFNSAANPFLA